MRPPSYMRSVDDQNVVMRRMSVFAPVLEAGVTTVFMVWLRAWSSATGMNHANMRSR